MRASGPQILALIGMHAELGPTGLGHASAGIYAHLSRGNSPTACCGKGGAKRCQTFACPNQQYRSREPPARREGLQVKVHNDGCCCGWRWARWLRPAREGAGANGAEAASKQLPLAVPKPTKSWCTAAPRARVGIGHDHGELQYHQQLRKRRKMRLYILWLPRSNAERENPRNAILALGSRVCAHRATCCPRALHVAHSGQICSVSHRSPGQQHCARRTGCGRQHWRQQQRQRRLRLALPLQLPWRMVTLKVTSVV